MAAKLGTVNVVGAGVFVVLSVPASALHDADADDNHDGLLDVAELERHEAALKAEIDRRLVVLDGATAARTVRVDLVLSPEHDAAGDRADHVVVLKHAELPAPPVDLRLRCDLFGERPSERELTITATRHPASGTETQVGVLTPGTTEIAFFPPPARSPGRALLAWIDGVPRGVLVVGVVVVVALGLGWASRSRKPASSPRG
jgi:hypothetical protein